MNQSEEKQIKLYKEKNVTFLEDFRWGVFENCVAVFKK